LVAEQGFAIVLVFQFWVLCYYFQILFFGVLFILYTIRLIAQIITSYTKITFNTITTIRALKATLALDTKKTSLRKVGINTPVAILDANAHQTITHITRANFHTIGDFGTIQGIFSST
jgi:hypothetical protein